MALLFLNDVANDAESTHKKIDDYVIFASLNRIPGLRLSISSLPGSASRTLVESLGKPCDVKA